MKLRAPPQARFRIGFSGQASIVIGLPNKELAGNAVASAQATASLAGIVLLSGAASAAAQATAALLKSANLSAAAIARAVAAASLENLFPGNSPTPFKVFRGGSQVGPAYATLHEAIVGTAQSGDTIKVAPGTYVISDPPGGGATQPGSIYFNTLPTDTSSKWAAVDGIQYNTLTIEWEFPGQRPIIDVTAWCAWQATHGGSPDGFVMGTGQYYFTVRGIHLKGLLSTDNSGGVRSKSGYYTTPPDGQGLESILTVEDCKFERFTNGIISTNNRNQKYYIRRSVFENCSGRDQAHGIYMGHSDTIEVDGCRFQNTDVVEFSRGHLFKSRAKYTRVRGSLLDSGSGCARLMDISNGGDLEVGGNILIHRGGGNPINAFPGQQDNQCIAFGPEQTTYWWGGSGGTGPPNNYPEYETDGRLHLIKLWQNTIRKTEGHRTGDPPQAFQILRIWPDILEPDGSPSVIDTTDGNGSTVRNNIVGSDTVNTTSSAHVFVTDWPFNTECLHTEIDFSGVYSGGVVPGNPAVNDAHTAWVADMTEPAVRTDTNRGGLIAGSTNNALAGSAVAGATASATLNVAGVKNLAGDAIAKAVGSGTLSNVAPGASPLELAAASLEAGQCIKLDTGLTSTHMVFPGDVANFIMWGNSLYWDPIRRQAGFIGKRNSNEFSYHWLVYDEVTNQWSNTREVWPEGQINQSGHGYDHNTCDPATGLIYHRPYGDSVVRVWNGISWSSLPSWGTPASSIAGGLTWFPGVGLIYADGAVLKRWNGTSWNTTVLPVVSSQYHDVCEYNPIANVVCFGAGNESQWRKMTAGLVVTQENYPPITIKSGGGTLCSDCVTDNMIGYDLTTGQFAQFNIGTGQWTGLTRSTGSGATPQNGLPNTTIDSNYQVIACPIPEYGVTMWVQWLGGTSGSGTPGAVWLYKHAIAPTNITGAAVGKAVATGALSVAGQGATALESAVLATTPGAWSQFRTTGQSNLSYDMFQVDGDSGPQTIFGYCDKGVYDPVRKQLRFVGAGHYGDLKFWSYDETTDWADFTVPQWYIDWVAAGARGGHAWHLNTVNPGNGDHYFMYASPRGGAHGFYKWNNNWSSLAEYTVAFPAPAAGLEYFPARNEILWCGRDQIRVYGVAGGSWTGSGNPYNTGDIQTGVLYSPQHNCLYFGGGEASVTGNGNLYRYNAAGSVIDLGALPHHFGSSSTSFSFIHPITGDIYCWSNTDSQWHRFDGNAWDTPSLGSNMPTMNHSDGVVYFPLPQYGAVLALRRNGSTPDMWIFRPGMLFDMNVNEAIITSQGGAAWLNGGVNGGNWHNVTVNNGVAYGATVVGGYDDCIAIVNTPSFPADQFVQGTVYRAPGYGTSGSSHEVELLLRFSITNGDAHGYEILWGRSGNGAVVRWNGPLGNYSPIIDNRPWGAAVDGDVLRGDIRGNIISIYKNGVLIDTANITSIGGTVYNSGKPGIGFWPTGSSTPSSYGWTKVQIGIC